MAIAAFNATDTIVPALTSIVESIDFYALRRAASPRIAISVVDDASADGTAAIIASFAATVDVDVYLSLNKTNCGRGFSRNRALAVAEADYYLFLDHDDEYMPEHITVCLDALTYGVHSDYVKTRVHLSDPVHPDWEPRIASSLTQNLCVRTYCHRLVGGFHEEPEVETYGCDDVLYNRAVRACFRGIEIAKQTVKFHRRPGNSFDRQYERKFSRAPALAQVTLSPLQQAVETRVWELHDRRLREVKVRLRRLAALARDGRS